ncbi:hypothetical protein SAMN05216349_12917 [Oribacterium sp. KHPX15]|jgi:hypothetical protein|uniref:hypothetical protein n=1 Tax=unclassified Oribacterium TaxID=2629782 RepID=UPI0004E1C3A6|nr:MULTISPECIES: hypothetical protein [unclassified Oribacterium]SEA79327.1 hypothetical protein SAMN05216349_12917 [Oribacterium sp. KHPX15]
MSDNKNIELNDEMMAKVTGGAEEMITESILFKIGERVVYLDGGAMIGKIRDVYPNENNILDSRYNVIFQNEVKRNIRHTRLRRVNS